MPWWCQQNYFFCFVPVMHLTVFQGRSLLLSSLSFWLAKGYGHDYQPEPCQSPGTFLSWLRGRKSMSATYTSCLKLNLWFKKKYFGKGFLAHYNSVIALDEVIVGHCCSLLYGTTRYKRVSLFCIILTKENLLEENGKKFETEIQAAKHQWML